MNWNKNIEVKIIVLFLIYGEEHYYSGLQEIKKIIDRMFPKNIKTFLIIDNSNTIEESLKGENHIIHGDNSFYEFSGWDKGYDYANKHLPTDDNTLFLFVNDTFHRRGYADGENFLDIFDSNIIKDKDIFNSAIGYLDDFPKEVILDNIVYRQWIRSNIFFLPYKIIQQCYPLTFPFPEEQIFSYEEGIFWSQSNLISENWKAYIDSWLFGLKNQKYPEYSLNWLKSEPLTLQNKEFFRRKAITILSEHYLTARLFRDQIPIIDTNIFQKDPDRHIKPYYKGSKV